MPFNLGGPELIIVLVIVLIVFGAGKLPSVMRDVGKGVKEFKRAQTEEEIEATNAASTSTPVTPPMNTTVPMNGSNGTTTTTTRTPETSSRA